MSKWSDCFDEGDEDFICPNKDCKEVNNYHMQLKMDMEDYNDGMAVYTGNTVKYVPTCNRCGCEVHSQ